MRSRGGRRSFGRGIDTESYPSFSLSKNETGRKGFELSVSPVVSFSGDCSLYVRSCPSHFTPGHHGTFGYVVGVVVCLTVFVCYCCVCVQVGSECLYVSYRTYVGPSQNVRVCFVHA